MRYISIHADLQVPGAEWNCISSAIGRNEWNKNLHAIMLRDDCRDWLFRRKAWTWSRSKKLDFNNQKTSTLNKKKKKKKKKKQSDK
ncbi:hypothetical protein T4A_10005 [Trichinella pseudospiralis]|uniref:Uncharacterized protein n=1 Tax=Trichinella pseudospiralis TaxID=6337 RepID=A0A0V1DUD2_TRIPS|nr:hypothetical protein T4A_10005 [Trichinella pseudospiralis]